MTKRTRGHAGEKPKYAGRQRGIVPVCLSLEREAWQLMRTHAPTNHYGRFLSRLIYEHAARVEERKRLTK